MNWRNIRSSAKKTLEELSKHKYIIIFDTETTGTGPDAKIIQFTGIRYEITDNNELKLVDDFRSLISSGDYLDFHMKPVDENGVFEPLKEKITEITGITNEFLKEKVPHTEQDRALEIYEFMSKASLWAAYNSPFDIRMLKQMEERTGILKNIENLTGQGYYRMPTIDVLPMARDCLPEMEEYKLKAVTEAIYPEKTFDFHDSSEDVKATAYVLAWCIEQYKEVLEKEIEEKESPKLKFAFYSQNPYMKSQRRIKISLRGEEEFVTDEETGRVRDISIGRVYWDIVKKRWSCKKDKKSQALFEKIDMEELEEQVLSKYAHKYQAHNMEELGKYMQKSAS